jgi:hypothetical protein
MFFTTRFPPPWKDRVDLGGRFCDGRLRCALSHGRSGSKANGVAAAVTDTIGISGMREVILVCDLRLPIVQGRD